MSKKMKEILVILSLVLFLCIATTSFGIAYARGVRGLGLLGITFFFTVGTVIVLAQLIPAGILFVSMIRSAFFPSQRHEMPARA